MNKVFYIVIFFAAISNSAFSQEKAEKKESFLKLSFDLFDQDMSNGWRKLEKEKKYLKAAQMIDVYINQKEELKVWQKKILFFHSGQMYAYNDTYKTAIKRFYKSLDTEGIMFNWNPYVKATIAFLEKDLKELKRQKKILTNLPKTPDGKIPNLDVIDRLIKKFNLPYREAYPKIEKN